MSHKTIALETSEASITTVAVTIKALQVGKKQMTQSIFRQLPEIDLVDEDALELAGKPWGHVRYHWGDHDPRKHHFVVEVDGVLHRSLFQVRRSEAFRFDPEDDNDDTCGGGYCLLSWELMRAVEALAYRRILDSDRARPSGDAARWFAFSPDPPHEFREGVTRSPDQLIPNSGRAPYDWEIRNRPAPPHVFPGQFSFICDPDEHVKALWEATDGHARDKRDLECCREDDVKNREWYERRIADRQKAAAAAAGKLSWLIGTRCGGNGDTEPAILEYARRVIGEMLAYRRDWDALMERLEAVEQLFIAV